MESGYGITHKTWSRITAIYTAQSYKQQVHEITIVSILENGKYLTHSSTPHEMRGLMSQTCSRYDHQPPIMEYLPHVLFHYAHMPESAYASYLSCWLTSTILNKVPTTHRLPTMCDLEPKYRSYKDNGEKNYFDLCQVENVPM